MTHCSRRSFLKAGIAASALAGTGSIPLRAARGSATDWVTLGKSGVKVTRLAFGTGTFSGQVQRDLGQEQFTRLVRHAYDNGIRFFETSETYHGMAEMLAIALKGLPRDSYRLMTKYSTPPTGAPATKIDLFRQQLESLGVAEEAGDVDQQILGEELELAGILPQSAEVPARIDNRGHRHPPLDPPPQRTRLVEREIVRRPRPQ